MSLYQNIYELVKTVPPGRVVAYGEVARAIGLKDSRKVGWAMHMNKSSEVPCHRVVNKEGRLAENFAFDGAEEQYRRLKVEGVGFVDKMHVDMKKFSWSFK